MGRGKERMWERKRKRKQGRKRKEKKRKGEDRREKRYGHHFELEHEENETYR